MKRAVPFIAVLLLASPAFAGDWLNLPQAWRDLMPVRAAEPAPAGGVHVNIPQGRVMPTPAKASDIIRLAPGKAKTIALERNAASIIVANPAHASVYLDNPRLAVIVPRAPGATGFTVLDSEGGTVLDQQIVVGEAEDAAYVRITRMCGSGQGAASCQSVSMYYCPDNCVSVAVPEADPNAKMPVPQSMAGNSVN
jgi:Flp pilus assembly secretin CpaC